MDPFALMTLMYLQKRPKDHQGSLTICDDVGSHALAYSNTELCVRIAAG